jgi:hypothetical protein
MYIYIYLASIEFLEIWEKTATSRLHRKTPDAQNNNLRWTAEVTSLSLAINWSVSP